jgi:putative ABC transport system permease protein
MKPEDLEPEKLYSGFGAPIRKEDKDEGDSHAHLSLKDLLRLSVRVFRVRPARTLLTISGIALGVGVVLFLVSLGYGFQYILIGNLATTQESLASLEVYYPPQSGLLLSPENISSFSAMRDVEKVATAADFSAEAKVVGVTDAQSGFVLVRVVDHAYLSLAGITPTVGESCAEGTSQVVVSGGALRVLGLSVDEASLGKRLDINVFRTTDEATGTVEGVAVKSDPVVVGIIEDNQPYIIVERAVIPFEPTSFGRVLIKARSFDLVAPLRDEIISQGFFVSTRADLVKQVQKITSIITIILGIFGVTALIVAAIGTFNTMVISFMERIFEVGIMKAVGATNKDIRNIFLMESLMMGFLGGLGGVLIGTGLGEGANLGVNLLAKSLGGKSVDLFVRPWWFILLIMGVSSCIGLLSGLWPARRAMGVSPKEAFIRK